MNLKVVRETGKYLWCLCPSHLDVNTPNLCVNKVTINGFPKGFAKCFCCGYKTQIPEEEVDKMSQKPTYYREKSIKKLTSAFVFQKMMQYWDNHQLSNYPGDIMGKHSTSAFLVGWTGKEYAVPGVNEYREFTSIQYHSLSGAKWYEEGSAPGIFVPISRLKKPVFICEGFKDTACAFDLGFYSIGKPSALVGNDIIVKFLIKHNIHKVVIVPDCDQAGYKGCENLQRILLTKDIEFDIISVEPWKDLREFCEKEGKEKTKELLNAKQS